MLLTMQQTATNSPQPSAADFAGLLAALTGSKPKQETAWNDAELADDVATLTYESALRTHSRYKAADLADWGTRAPAEPEPAAVTAQQPEPTAVSRAAEARPSRDLTTSADFSPVDSAHIEQDKKCASITIRMSKAECIQLRQRAAEARMSVSAYLRSCTFEAEALRAQVKEALAELKCASPHQPQIQPAPAHGNRRTWIGRMKSIMPPWRARQKAA